MGVCVCVCARARARACRLAAPHFDKNTGCRLRTEYLSWYPCRGMARGEKKLNCTLVQALRLCTGRTAHRGSRRIALLFHDHGTRRGWRISVKPRSLFTPGKDPVPIVQEAGWAPGPVWTGAENLASAGIRSPDRPARCQSLYRLRCPAHWQEEIGSFISGRCLWESYVASITNNNKLVQDIGGMMKGNWSTHRKISLIAPLPTTVSIWTDLASNLSLCGDSSDVRVTKVGWLKTPSSIPDRSNRIFTPKSVYRPWNPTSLLRNG
jgi:hypothetical protein